MLYIHIYTFNLLVVSIDSTKKSIVSLGSILPYFFPFVDFVGTKENGVYFCIICVQPPVIYSSWLHTGALKPLDNSVIDMDLWVYGRPFNPWIQNTPLKTNMELILNTTFKREHINLETRPIHFFFAFEVGIQKEKYKISKTNHIKLLAVGLLRDFKTCYCNDQLTTHQVGVHPTKPRKNTSGHHDDPIFPIESHYPLVICYIAIENGHL